MSKTPPTTVRRPRYVSEFVCAADKCIDNCCHRWSINLDKPTYELYTRGVTDSVLKPLIERHIRRNRQGTGAVDYGRIVLKDDANCPFLTRDKLCRIQKTLGAGALSYVCRSYPRHQLALGGALEQHAAMSCPEVARKILGDPRALDFDDREADTGEVLPASQTVAPDAAAAGRFLALRDAAVALIDAHAPSTDAGLFAVVMLAQAADERSGPGEPNDGGFQSWLQARVRLLALPHFAQGFDKVQVDPSIPMRLLKEIVIERLAAPGIERAWPRYLQTIAECLHGLNYSDDEPESSLRGYRSAVAAFERFAAAQPWAMRNIAVYDVMKSALFTPGEPAMKQVLRLVIRYTYLRFLLTGLCAYWGEAYGLEHRVHAAYAFSRAIEHNPGFVQRIVGLLEAQELHGAAGLAVLLKG